jgi:hypothetical protein
MKCRNNIINTVIRHFTATDISGMAKLSGQTNQRAATLPNWRIVTARFESHNVNVTCTHTVSKIQIK